MREDLTKPYQTLILLTVSNFDHSSFLMPPLSSLTIMSYDKDKMRIYLKTLKQEITDEKWTYMIVNAHDETFEPVYQK